MHASFEIQQKINGFHIDPESDPSDDFDEELGISVVEESIMNSLVVKASVNGLDVINGPVIGIENREQSFPKRWGTLILVIK